MCCVQVKHLFPKPLPNLTQSCNHSMSSILYKVWQLEKRVPKKHSNISTNFCTKITNCIDLVLGRELDLLRRKVDCDPQFNRKLCLISTYRLLFFFPFLVIDDYEVVTWNFPDKNYSFVVKLNPSL
jgi:hypothetical protein